MKYEVRAFANRPSEQIDIVVIREDRILQSNDGDKTYSFCNPPLYEYAPPTLRIGRNEAQSLIDELWTIGIRPTEGSGSAGAMAAVQEHVSDLRRLVFDHEITPRM